MSENFDVIIIGAGQAGPPLAGRLTAAGQKVALIERELVGGTCVNTGCTPTKTMVASAYAAHLARRAADYGVMIGGAVTVDMAAVKARKDKVVANSRNGLEDWLKGMDGLSFIRGHARFIAEHEIVVGEQRLKGDKIFINVGGRASIPSIPGLQSVDYCTNSSILKLTDVPEHLIVLGGSYVALEFAQMFRRFGARVTVIERGDRLIKREDPDISAALKAILEGEGLTFRLSTEIDFVERRNGKTGVRLKGKGEIIEGSHLLVALGRQPNTDDLGLEIAGIKTDKRGFIDVDETLKSSADNVWALGECNGRGAFTHTSYNDFEIVAANLLDGEQRRVGDRLPAYALYTDPPLGRVGMTETEARESGRRIKIGQRPMTRVSRAVEKGEAQGLMKVVIDVETDAVLGAAILGPSGDEAIHALLDTMTAGAPASALGRTMHIHPTVSELIPTIIGEAKPVD